MTEIKEFYQFGEFRLDVLNKTLFKNGEPISLTPKVYDTLLVLLENAGNLIEKDDLMQQIWNDRFVEESNLAFNIKRLRNVLGDDASNPKFIENVPRRGYRFITEVSKVTENKAKPNQLKKISTPLFFSKGQIFAAVGLILLICSIVYATWLWQKEKNIPIFSNKYSLTKLSETGKVFHSTISPDGKLIVYSSKTGNKESLWIRQLDSGTNTELVQPSEEPYYGLEFSADGKTLFFTRKNENNKLNLYRISILGGIPQKLFENTQGDIIASADGKYIAFVRYNEGFSDKNTIYIADVDGTNERILCESKAPKVFWTINFSPDSKKIVAAYGHTNTGSQNMELIEIDSNTGEEKSISEEKFFNISTINWLPNQTGLIISAGKKINEPSKLWQVDYPSGKITLLRNDSNSFSNLELSQNGDKLSGITANSDFHLSLSDTDNVNKQKELAQARDGLSFTSDGKIVYASDTSGPEDIWIMNADGTNQRQLTTDKDLDAYPLVSKDDRFIYFTSNRTGELQVWRMNIDGTEQTQITKKDGGFPLLATSDGKILYYARNKDFSVQKLLLDTGEETEIIAKKSLPYCAFSPNEDLFAYISKGKDSKTFKIDVMNLADKSIIKTFEVEKSAPYYLTWLNDGKTLAYLFDENSETTSLWQQKLDEPKPSLITNLKNEDINDLKFMPNSNSFAIIHGEWKHDAVLITGLK